uniref:RNA helicase n=1 Tax=Anopheles atroparvus TaxID=41427 RepID=A0AAG5DTS4_ANOAO
MRYNFLLRLSCLIDKTKLQRALSIYPTNRSREPYVSTDAATSFRPGNGGNFNKLDEVPVRVCGRNPPASLGYTFLRAGLRKDVLMNMRKAEYTWPTPIQRYAIPVVLAGRDLLVCAQTGSGKKAAFVLPLINRLLSLDILEDESAPNPYILIVAPVQDIAHQIYSVARKFIRGTPLRMCLICGGTSMGYQQRLLDEGCHVMVATLSRLHQFLSRGSISLRNVKYLVLDDVDRILNMGFRPAIDQLLSVEHMPPNKARQTLMFSASFPLTVQELAAKLLHDHISVFVSVVGSAAADIEQIIYEVEQLRKRAMLEEILREDDASGTLIFVKMKRNVDRLAIELEKQHFTTVSVHGDRPHHEREEAISDFRNGRKDVLIATSVISRDLDFRSVRHVINYDMPTTIGEYVQRIGLTGRVGSKGRATSFYDPCVDHRMATYLMQVLNETGQAVPNFLDAAANMHAGRWEDLNFIENVEVSVVALTPADEKQMDRT